MRFAVVTAVVLLLLSASGSSEGSLLSVLDRVGSPVPEIFPDPFRILEHVPFALDRDDVALVAPARVDWKETPDSHLIMVEVPGMKREDMKIEVEGRMLRVSGEHKREEEKKGDRWHCVERTQGKFWRQFRLPDNIDLDKVEAKLADGVLTVNLPKLAPDQVKGPRVVSIGGNEGDRKEKLGGEGDRKEKLGGGGGEAQKIEL